MPSVFGLGVVEQLSYVLSVCHFCVAIEIG